MCRALAARNGCIALNITESTNNEESGERFGGHVKGKKTKKTVTEKALEKVKREGGLKGKMCVL